MSDGYASIVSGLSLARPYNGIKRIRRATPTTSSRVRERDCFRISVRMRGVIAAREATAG
jgi:hypothetical protein